MIQRIAATRNVRTGHPAETDLSLAAPPRFAYWIVMPPRVAERPLVKEFRDWLLAEASAMQQGSARRRVTKG